MPWNRQFPKERVRREDELRTARTETSMAVGSKFKEIDDDSDGEEEISDD